MSMESADWVRSFSRPRRIGILDLLKRSEALSVREIADHLGMSYMGAKQHCAALEKAGYLATWRRPREGVVGRPVTAYRLTRKADELFPTASNPLTIGILEAAAGLYGPLAPEKLLYRHFEEVIGSLARRVRGSDPLTRAHWLARLRDADGCVAGVVSEAPLTIVERHAPLSDVMEKFPCIARFEEELFSRIIGVRMVRRTGGRLPEGATAFVAVDGPKAGIA